MSMCSCTRRPLEVFFILVEEKDRIHMLSALVVVLTLGCTPNPTLRCPRTFSPVCADNTEYSNLCHAQAAGFHGECASMVVDGPCGNRGVPMTPTFTCSGTEVHSETGKCVPRPWSDYSDCATEKRQGACPNGYDPNPWVAENCAVTCAT